LATVILLETGSIERFADAGHYASYCRCVGSAHMSNGKKKGHGNTRNGNRYLAWAFVEAANFAVRRCDAARRFYQRKKASRNSTVAINQGGRAQAGACLLPHAEEPGAVPHAPVLCIEMAAAGNPVSGLDM
jgi:transposase